MNIEKTEELILQYIGTLGIHPTQDKTLQHIRSNTHLSFKPPITTTTTTHSDSIVQVQTKIYDNENRSTMYVFIISSISL